MGEGFTFLIKSGCKQGNRERQWHKMYLLHTEKTSDRQFHVLSFADTYDPAYLIQDIKGWSVCVCVQRVYNIYIYIYIWSYATRTLQTTHAEISRPSRSLTGTPTFIHIHDQGFELSTSI